MTSFGLSFLSIVPVRAEPSETSEMVSQLLFGESFSVLQANDRWLCIRTHADDYQGWVSANMVVLTKQIPRCVHIVSRPLVTCQILPDNTTIYVPGGSRFSEFQHAGKTYLLDDAVTDATGKDIVALAEQYLGAPYLWGGKTVLGIDCSGLVQVVCSMAGISLPRDASLQAAHGKAVAFEEAVRGDLAFFGNEQGQVKHVGILCDADNIIHASGCVRKDRFDREGIFHSTEQRYTHHLHSIKRLSIC